MQTDEVRKTIQQAIELIESLNMENEKLRAANNRLNERVIVLESEAQGFQRDVKLELFYIRAKLEGTRI